MRTPDPDWKLLAAEPFGSQLSEATLKYRADAVRRWMQLREDHPPGKPAVVEIGSNRGRFLKGLCAARPDVSFYGIEIKKSLVEVSQRRLDRHELHNGKALQGDARIGLPVFFGEKGLERIYVLFPDPWWKKRHAKRRLVDAEFVEMMTWVLEPGGIFVLKTDVARYAREVRATVTAHPRFERVDVADVPHADTWVQTTRERHCTEDGLPVHTFCAKLV